MLKNTIKSPPVPLNYMGVWQRQLLETDTFKDETTLVLWMQSQHYHIDIRLPVTRSKLRAVNALSDYTDGDLLILAEQQGFAGITHVEAAGEQSSEVCQWLREIDYQPSNSIRDIGKMVFTDANTLIEMGVDQAYLEVWRRLENSQDKYHFQFTAGNNRQGLEAPAYLMRAGNYVAYMRSRTVALPSAQSLNHAIQTYKPTREQLLDWLDMEISFGEMLDEQSWQIKYSSLPYKESLAVSFD